MSDAEKLKNIHDVIADYIYTDISAVDCMEKIIDIFGDAEWFLGKEDGKSSYGG